MADFVVEKMKLQTCLVKNCFGIFRISFSQKQNVRGINFILLSRFYPDYMDIRTRLMKVDFLIARKVTAASPPYLFRLFSATSALQTCRTLFFDFWLGSHSVIRTSARNSVSSARRSPRTLCKYTSNRVILSDPTFLPSTVNRNRLRLK